jgi:hypothetical protein
MDTRFDVLAKVAAGGMSWRDAARRLIPRLPKPTGDNGLAFDNLARAMAEELPRREALRRIGGGLATTMLISLGLSKVAWGQGGGGRSGPTLCTDKSEVGACIALASAVLTAALALCTAATGGVFVAGCAAIATGTYTKALEECQKKSGCPPRTRCSNNVCCPGSQTGCRSAQGDRSFCCESDETCCEGICCLPSQTCSNRKCCPSGQVNCSNTCVNTGFDANNCGACGNVCTVGKECVAGTCACPLGKADCGGTCVDTATDPSNCGFCGHVCAGGQTCSSGQCSGCPDGTPPCNGHCCPAGETCNSGSCKCDGGVSCPAGSRCCPGWGCVNTQLNSQHCGGCNQPCAQAPCCEGVCLYTRSVACCDGKLTDVTSDPNCGLCGFYCNPSATGLHCVPDQHNPGGYVCQ